MSRIEVILRPAALVAHSGLLLWSYWQRVRGRPKPATAPPWTPVVLDTSHLRMFRGVVTAAMPPTAKRGLTQADKAESRSSAERQQYRRLLPTREGLGQMAGVMGSLLLLLGKGLLTLLARGSLLLSLAVGLLPLLVTGTLLILTAAPGDTVRLGFRLVRSTPSGTVI